MMRIMMKKNSRLEILRLADIETRREGRFERALQSGNIDRAVRAADHLTAVSSRVDRIAMGAITTFTSN
jgi:hypothetical protein